MSKRVVAGEHRLDNVTDAERAALEPLEAAVEAARAHAEETRRAAEKAQRAYHTARVNRNAAVRRLARQREDGGCQGCP